mgnify:CR=1 FL=1
MHILVKADLGTKRACPSCNVRFYDLAKRPIECPKCGFSFEPETLFKQRRSRAAEPAGAGVIQAQDTEDDDEDEEEEEDEAAESDEEEEETAEESPLKDPATGEDEDEEGQEEEAEQDPAEHRAGPVVRARRLARIDPPPASVGLDAGERVAEELVLLVDRRCGTDVGHLHTWSRSGSIGLGLAGFVPRFEMT